MLTQLLAVWKATGAMAGFMMFIWLFLSGGKDLPQLVLYIWPLLIEAMLRKIL